MEEIAVGTIVSSKAIGKKGTNRQIWAECPNCHFQRWVVLGRNREQAWCRTCAAGRGFVPPPGMLVTNAHALGMAGYGKMVWSACPECGFERWASKNMVGHRCRKCAWATSQLIGRTKGIKHPNAPRGAAHRAWTGGKKKHIGGYLYVYADATDPIAVAMTRSIPYVLEHRLVMAHAIGRPLKDYEEVHHRNGRRQDNRLVNLELWIKSQPAGQRVTEYHCPGCQCDTEETSV